MKKSIKLNLEEDTDRIYVTGSVSGADVTFLIDTGCINTLIPTKLAEAIDRDLVLKKTKIIKIGGSSLEVGEMTVPFLFLGKTNSFKLKNVKVHVGLGDEWEGIVILGLNVLNHLVTTIDRTDLPGYIQFTETSKAQAFSDTVYNRLIKGNTYKLEGTAPLNIPAKETPLDDVLTYYGVDMIYFTKVVMDEWRREGRLKTKSTGANPAEMMKWFTEANPNYRELLYK